MMTQHRKPITKEQYERAMEHGGFIYWEDRRAIFDSAELDGYGVYLPMARKEGDEYYVSYELGSTCD